MLPECRRQSAWAYRACSPSPGMQTGVCTPANRATRDQSALAVHTVERASNLACGRDARAPRRRLFHNREPRLRWHQKGESMEIGRERPLGGQELMNAIIAASLVEPE